MVNLGFTFGRKVVDEDGLNDGRECGDEVDEVGEESVYPVVDKSARQGCGDGCIELRSKARF